MTMVLLLALALPVWHLYGIYKNYQFALKIGLPIIITPINPTNPLWVLVGPYLHSFLAGVPFGLEKWASYSYLGWSWKDKYAMHARLGSAFTITNLS
jgi:hypothetical protein